MVWSERNRVGNPVYISGKYSKQQQQQQHSDVVVHCHCATVPVVVVVVLSYRRIISCGIPCARTASGERKAAGGKHGRADAGVPRCRKAAEAAVDVEMELS